MASTRKSKCLLITSTKGGVGKTIFAINLAGIISTIEKKVLIIDLDLTGGSVALYLNKPYNKSIYEMSEDIKNNVFSDFDEYTIKYNEYISAIACPKDPRDASKIDLRYLDIIIDQAYFKYDAIIIDSTHDLNPTNLYLMDKVDEVMFLINNDPLCLKSTRSIVAILNNMGINNYKILLNNSNNPYKNYYSIYDIRKIIQANIDYTISNGFFIQDIDKKIANSEIVTLNDNVARIYNKEYASMMDIATSLIQGGDNNGQE